MASTLKVHLFISKNDHLHCTSQYPKSFTIIEKNEHRMRQKGTLVIHWTAFGGIMCSETYFFRSFLLMCVRCISCSFLYFRFVVSLWKYSHCEWLTVCYTEEMNPNHTHTHNSTRKDKKTRSKTGKMGIIMKRQRHIRLHDVLVLNNSELTEGMP